MSIRGRQRETEIAHELYHSDHYFDMYQLAAFCHQIRDIHLLNPGSILEIGIGNGFTSTYLKSCGYEVTTCDINPTLRADMICDIFDLPKNLGKTKFDTIVCCEVLEHLPFDEFEKAIALFSEISDQLYLTLPYYPKFVGFSGFLDIPRIRRLMNIGIFLPIPRKITPEHYWEIGHSRETRRSRIFDIIRRYFPDTIGKPYELSRYHHRFICKKTAF